MSIPSVLTFGNVDFVKDSNSYTLKVTYGVKSFVLTATNVQTQAAAKKAMEDSAGKMVAFGLAFGIGTAETKFKAIVLKGDSLECEKKDDSKAKVIDLKAKNDDVYLAERSEKYERFSVIVGPSMERVRSGKPEEKDVHQLSVQYQQFVKNRAERLWFEQNKDKITDQAVKDALEKNTGAWSTFTEAQLDIKAIQQHIEEEQNKLKIKDAKWNEANLKTKWERKWNDVKEAQDFLFKLSEEKRIKEEQELQLKLEQEKLAKDAAAVQVSLTA